MIKNDELLIYTQLDKIDTDDLKQKFISIIKYGKFNLFDSFNIYGSAIFKYDDTILAYCDKQLSFPLYINKINGTISTKIDSNINAANGDAQISFNSNKYGYVIGNDTFLNNILQLRAGEYCIINRNGCHINNYTKYTHGIVDSKIELLLLELDTIIDNAIRNLIQIANGSNIILSLSSGKDSLIILLKLMEIGYDKVLTYSFGKHNSYEHFIARNVSKQFGLEYTFLLIEYNKNKLLSLFNYLNLAPYTPRYLFVPVLEQLLDYKNDSIFTAGIGGDFLTGRFVHDNMMDIDINNKTMLNWNMLEYQTKFRNRHIDVYKYYDLKFFMPYFDNDYVKFWNKVPASYKINQYLYTIYYNYLIKKLNVKLDNYDGVANLYDKANEEYYVFNLGSKDTDINDEIKQLYYQYVCDRIGK